MILEFINSILYKNNPHKIVNNIKHNGKPAISFFDKRPYIVKENCKIEQLVLLGKARLVDKLPFTVKHVGQSFACEDYGLKTLKGCPEHVGQHYNVSENRLTSLEHSPKEMKGGHFTARGNCLTSFEGAPKFVKGIDLRRNQITSLEGAPRVEKFFVMNENLITSLVGVHRYIPHAEIVCFAGNPVVEGGIGLLLIDGLGSLDIGEHLNSAKNRFKRNHNISQTQFIASQYHKLPPNRFLDEKELRFFNAMMIIHKYLKLKKGREVLLECAAELSEAGLDEFAKI